MPCKVFIETNWQPKDPEQMAPVDVPEEVQAAVVYLGFEGQDNEESML